MHPEAQVTLDDIWQWSYRFVLYGDTPRKGEKLWRGEQGRHDPTTADPNPTLDGVTQRAFEAFTGQPGASVFDMTDDQRRDIYYQNYWLPSGAGKIAAMDKPKLALCHFVTAVNTGMKPAAKMLQRAVRAPAFPLVVDGAIGPKTLDAIADVEDREAATKYTGQLVRHYRALAEAREDLRPNLKGWLLRVTAIQREIGLV